jgi:hypothetical protein
MAREHPTTPNHASNIGEASSASNPTVGWSLKRICCDSKDKVEFFLQLRTYDIHQAPLWLDWRFLEDTFSMFHQEASPAELNGQSNS